MEAEKKSIQTLGITTGLVMFVALVAYFLLMKSFNLIHITELRCLNFFILLGGLMYAYRQYKRPDMNVEYLSGMGLGVITTAVSVLPFALFIYIYFSYVDLTFIQVLKEHSVMMGEYLTPGTAAGTVAVEGICSGLIISFAIMQYYKSGFKKGDKDIEVKQEISPT